MSGGFNNPVVGGLEKLIREAIQSPNYVPGTSGWTINRDGSVEFNNGIFRGTLQAGTLIAGLITDSSISNSSFGDGNILNSSIADSNIVIDSSGGTLLVYAVSGQTVTDLTIAGAGVFNVPAGVTFLKVEAVGGGGGGSGSYADGGITAAGSSGSGGEYAREDHYVVTPLAALNYVVGAAGAGGTGVVGGSSVGTVGGDGGDTSFDGTGVVAHKGHGGFGGFPIAGGSGSTNSIHFNGGANALGPFGQAGCGGAGSGGSSSNGHPGNPAPSDNVQGAGATAVNGGGAGGQGGDTNLNGSPGLQPGGGGGGAGALRPATVRNGGAGGIGRIRLTYGGSITLIASVAGVAGVDQYGNAYPAGIRTNVNVSAGLSGGYYEELTYPPTVCATGTPTTLIANATVKLISDYASAYNMTSGAWTCPADGVYDIQAGVAIPAFGPTFEGHGTIDFSTAAAAGGTIYRRSSQSVNINEAYENIASFTKFFTTGQVVFVSFTQSSTGPRTTLVRNAVLTFVRRG